MQDEAGVSQFSHSYAVTRTVPFHFSCYRLNFSLHLALLLHKSSAWLKETLIGGNLSVLPSLHTDSALFYELVLAHLISFSISLLISGFQKYHNFNSIHQFKMSRKSGNVVADALEAGGIHSFRIFQKLFFFCRATREDSEGT